MMKSNLSDDLITITQKLMMARERSEIINLASEYNALIERAMQLEKQGNAISKQQAKSVTTIIKFTSKEIQMMSFTFKKEFIANGLAAHVLKKESGRNSYCYEIRYRSNGYNITASSTDLREAKRKFLAKTVPGEIEKYRVKKLKTGMDLLEEVFDEWYMIKQGTITDKALKTYHTHFYKLPENLRRKTIKAIRAVDLDKIIKEATPRKYEELRTLFNAIFKYAIASGIISHNPVALIPFRRAERQSRDRLTQEEIATFLKQIEAQKYKRIRQGMYLMYFFGLRPCEIEDEAPRREGEFLIARNRKRKGGKIEYKKIPIPIQAEDLIDWDKPLSFDVSRKIREKWIKEIFNDKTAYNLRHTFNSICREYVRSDIVEIWMGDSPTRLIDKVYTHFSDDFMRKQMDMVVFPTLESLEA